MDGLKKVVIEKLKRYNLPDFGSLSEKEQRRLINIETYIKKCAEIRDDCIKKYRNFKISKKGFSEAFKSDVDEFKKIKISRKTIYNDDLITIVLHFLIANRN